MIRRTALLSDRTVLVMLCECVIADGSTMIWTTVSKTLCCMLGVNCGVAPHGGVKMVRARGGIE